MGVTLYRLGGHFNGGSVLHWENDVNKQGVLLTGDIIQVVADRQWVSFMYSYPNLIPLPANKVYYLGKKEGLPCPLAGKAFILFFVILELTICLPSVQF